METLSYEWIVPAYPTSQAKIKIVQDNVNEDYEDVSPNFTITGTTGIGGQDHTNQFKMYPNPMTDYTIVELRNFYQRNPVISIIDTRGSIVRSIQNIHSGIVKVDRQNLAVGLYLILLSDGDKTLVTGRLAIE